MIRRFTSRSGNQDKQFVSPPVNLKARNTSFSRLKKGGIILMTLLLSFIVVQNQLQAQCDIGYTGSQSITLSLDEFGVATINSVLFETYVSSSNAACHPNGGGNLNLYVDAAKTTVFPATNYNCTDVGSPAIDLFVALMNNNNGSESAAIPFDVTIIDAYTPDLVCAFDVTQNLPVSTCTATVNDIDPITASDNCNGMTLTYSITGATTASGSNDASGTNFNPGVSTVTYTATDASGNTNSCSSTVTVSFPQPYSITGCSTDMTIDVDAGVCTATVTYLTPSEINGCPVTFTADAANVASGSALMPGTYPIAFDFDNGTDNVACNFTITVEDNEDPVVSFSNESITTSGCQANYSNTADATEISDNCTAFGDLTIGWSLSGGSTFAFGIGTSIPNQLLDVGDYTITYTATDAAGNIESDSYTLSVLENIPPVAMTMDITVALNLNGDVTVNAADVDGGSTDNCSTMTFEIMETGGLWVSSVDYDCTDIGANTVNFRAIDANGNVSMTETAVITIEDNFVPVAMCEDITVTIPGGTSVTVNAIDIDNGSADNCANIASYEITVDEDNDGSFEVAYAASYTANCPTPASGFVNAKLRVTDDSTPAANAECLAKITILDDTPPVAMAMNVSVNLDANGDVTVNASQFDNGSTEDCGTMTFAFADGAMGTFTTTKDYSCTTTGTYSDIFLEVSNSAGLSSTAGPVTLTVSDNMAPMANCVAGLTVGYDAAGNISVPAVDLNDGSTDNCTITSLRVSDTGAAGSFVTTYTGDCSMAPANLILQVSDGTNSSTCTVPITIEDTVPPTAVCHTNLSVSLISNSVVIFASQVDAGSADACSAAAPSLAVTRVINNNPGTYSNNVAFDCNDVSAIQMVRLRVTDGAGLTSTCNSFIDVQETQPPVFGASFPSSPQTVECSDYTTNGSLSFDAAAMASPTDNCGTVTVTFTDSGNLVTNACSASTITRTYTATDSSGNSSMMSLTINVTDTTKPTFTRPADMDLECDSAAGLPYSEANAGEPTDEDDNCDTQVTDGGLREATSSTYHGFFDFKDHTGDVTTAYNFDVAQWTSSSATLVDVTGAPALVELTSPNAGSAGQVDFSITAPATGWVVFDYSTSSADAAANDPFGYSINGTFTALDATSSATRAIVSVTAGQNFAFTQQSINGTNGSAVTTVRSFTFVDAAITTPQPVVCANNFDVARFWSLDDCAGNAAADQFQRISISDTTAPAFVFDNNFTADSPEATCTPFVDLDMTVAGRLVEACNLVSVTNDAATLYGNGNGTDDASGFYAPGSYTVTFTAADACNPTTTFVVNFTVADNTNPTVICHDLVNVTIPNSGTAVLSPNTVIASVSDNCALDNSSFTVTPNTFTNSDFGLNPVVVSVTDVNGNTTTCNSVADVVGSVEYDPAEVSGAAGSTINLPVVTRHFTDVNSFSMSVNLVDPTVATIVEVTDFHPSLTGTGNFNIINSGKVDVSYFDANTTLPNLDDVVLFNVRIQFNPLATPGDITDVTLSDILSFRDDAAGTPQSIPTLGFAGSAEVAAASALQTISGNIRTITSPVENVDSVTVNLTGTTVNSMLTTTDGNYSFDVPAGSNQTVTPYKNINWRNGGNVNILDVLALHRLSLGIDSYTSTSQEVAADSDGMNGVNILDVLLAHRISLGIIDEIPTNTSWLFVDSDLGVPTAPTTNGFAEARTYNNITADITGADFLGIKVCNVVGSASGIGFMSDSADERDEPLYFNVDNFALVAGQDYTVEVKAKDFNHISAYQYNLLLNAEYAELNSITPGSISNMSLDNFNTLRSTEGVIGTDWYELNPVDVVNETVLFTLNFKAIQGDIQLSEILSIDNENELAFHANGDNEVGEVELEFSTTTAVNPVTANDFALLQNKPNPFSSETIISFVLPENAETTLTIIDVAGKAVFQTKTQAQKGYNELKVNASDLPSTGVFHYRLDSEVGAAVRKMVILR